VIAARNTMTASGGHRSHDPTQPGRGRSPAGALAAMGRGGEGEAPNRAVELLGRVGIASYGVVHVVIGVIAVGVAASGGQGQADQQGALSTLATQPFGVVLIVVAVAGLVAFGFRQGLAALTGFRWTSGRDRAKRRLASGGHALGVLGVAAIGVKLLVTGSSGSSSTSTQEATAGLLSLPAGRAAVVAVALVVLAAAGTTARTGVTCAFIDDLDESRLPGRARTSITVLGVSGYLARAIAFAVVGVLFGAAALRHDPSQAGGLDAALRVLAEQPFGPVLLGVVAAGFAAFGLFTLAEAKARRI
jgi:hypothetical protein